MNILIVIVIIILLFFIFNIISSTRKQCGGTNVPTAVMSVFIFKDNLDNIGLKVGYSSVQLTTLHPFSKEVMIHKDDHNISHVDINHYFIIRGSFLGNTLKTFLDNFKRTYDYNMKGNKYNIECIFWDVCVHKIENETCKPKKWIKRLDTHDETRKCNDIQEAIYFYKQIYDYAIKINNTYDSIKCTRDFIWDNMLGSNEDEYNFVDVDEFIDDHKNNGIPYNATFLDIYNNIMINDNLGQRNRNPVQRFGF